MTRPIVITGRGVVSPLGDSAGALHGALCGGRSGLRPIQGFDTQGLACGYGGEIQSFSPRDYLGRRNLRPLDRTSRLLAVAAHLALADSGWSVERRRGHEVGLVLGTMFCSVHTISAFDRRALTRGPSYASPLDFANTVINAAAGQIAILHHLQGINSTIAAGATSGTRAIAYACDLLRSGRAKALLAGGVEELCFESFLGFHRTGQICGSANGRGPCHVPFDARRNGFALGEAAALVMLEDGDSAAARGAPILAEVRGSGSGFDVSLGKDEAHSVKAMARSMEQALGAAQATLEEVDCLSASANGSVCRDRQEARAVDQVFAGRELPVTAIKSMLGETLGASGAVQTVALVEALGDGVLPGIAGLTELEDEFPLAGVSSANRRGSFRLGLVNSLGFEGNCSSLLVERAAGPSGVGQEGL